MTDNKRHKRQNKRFVTLMSTSGVLAFAAKNPGMPFLPSALQFFIVNDREQA